VKNESGFARKLNSFLKRLKKSVADPPALIDPIDPIGQLVMGLLEWESTHASAKIAHDRLMDQMVDYNDLRVSHPQEIKAIMGNRYPKADDRIDRLLRVLQEIYIRQHAVLLDGLVRKSKKEVRAYLDSMPGMPSYVAAQMTVLCFGGHAVPVDEVLVNLKMEEEEVWSQSIPIYIFRCASYRKDAPSDVTTGSDNVLNFAQPSIARMPKRRLKCMV